MAALSSPHAAAMPTGDAARRPTLDTERLTLVALAAADLDAWLTGDAAALEQRKGETG